MPPCMMTSFLPPAESSTTSRVDLSHVEQKRPRVSVRVTVEIEDHEAVQLRAAVNRKNQGIPVALQVVEDLGSAVLLGSGRDPLQEWRHGLGGQRVRLRSPVEHLHLP